MCRNVVVFILEETVLKESDKFIIQFKGEIDVCIMYLLISCLYFFTPLSMKLTVHEISKGINNMSIINQTLSLSDGDLLSEEDLGGNILKDSCFGTYGNSIGFAHTKIP